MNVEISCDYATTPSSSTAEPLSTSTAAQVADNDAPNSAAALLATAVAAIATQPSATNAASWDCNALELCRCCGKPNAELYELFTSVLGRSTTASTTTTNIRNNMEPSSSSSCMSNSPAHSLNTATTASSTSITNAVGAAKATAQGQNNMENILQEMQIWELRIKSNDGLPQRICPKCTAQFSMIHKFRRKCQKVQLRLQALYEERRLEEQQLLHHKETSLNLPPVLDIGNDLINDNYGQPLSEVELFETAWNATDAPLLDNDATPTKTDSEMTTEMLASEETDGKLNNALAVRCLNDSMDLTVKSNLDEESLLEAHIIFKTNDPTVDDIAEQREALEKIMQSEDEPSLDKNEDNDVAVTQLDATAMQTERVFHKENAVDTLITSNSEQAKIATLSKSGGDELLLSDKLGSVEADQLRDAEKDTCLREVKSDKKPASVLSTKTEAATSKERQETGIHEKLTAEQLIHDKEDIKINVPVELVQLKSEASDVNAKEATDKMTSNTLSAQNITSISSLPQNQIKSLESSQINVKASCVPTPEVQNLKSEHKETQLQTSIEIELAQMSSTGIDTKHTTSDNSDNIIVFNESTASEISEIALVTKAALKEYTSPLTTNPRQTSSPKQLTNKHERLINKLEKSRSRSLTNFSTTSGDKHYHTHVEFKAIVNTSSCSSLINDVDSNALDVPSTNSTIPTTSNTKLNTQQQEADGNKWSNKTTAEVSNKITLTTKRGRIFKSKALTIPSDKKRVVSVPCIKSQLRACYVRLNRLRVNTVVKKNATLNIEAEQAAVKHDLKRKAKDKTGDSETVKIKLNESVSINREEIEKEAESESELSVVKKRKCNTLNESANDETSTKSPWKTKAEMKANVGRENLTTVLHTSAQSNSNMVASLDPPSDELKVCQRSSTKPIEKDVAGSKKQLEVKSKETEMETETLKTEPSASKKVKLIIERKHGTHYKCKKDVPVRELPSKVQRSRKHKLQDKKLSSSVNIQKEGSTSSQGKIATEGMQTLDTVLKTSDRSQIQHKTTNDEVVATEQVQNEGSDIKTPDNIQIQSIPPKVSSDKKINQNKSKKEQEPNEQVEHNVQNVRKEQDIPINNNTTISGSANPHLEYNLRNTKDICENTAQDNTSKPESIEPSANSGKKIAENEEHSSLNEKRHETILSAVALDQANQIQLQETALVTTINEQQSNESTGSTLTNVINIIKQHTTTPTTTDTCKENCYTEKTSTQTPTPIHSLSTTTQKIKESQGESELIVRVPLSILTLDLQNILSKTKYEPTVATQTEAENINGSTNFCISAAADCSDAAGALNSNCYTDRAMNNVQTTEMTEMTTTSVNEQLQQECMLSSQNDSEQSDFFGFVHESDTSNEQLDESIASLDTDKCSIEAARDCGNEALHASSKINDFINDFQANCIDASEIDEDQSPAQLLDDDDDMDMDNDSALAEQTMLALTHNPQLLSACNLREMNDVETTLNGILNEMQDQHIYTPVSAHNEDFFSQSVYSPLSEPPETPTHSMYATSPAACMSIETSPYPVHANYTNYTQSLPSINNNDDGDDVFTKNFPNYGECYTEDSTQSELIGFQNDIPCFENIEMAAAAAAAAAAATTSASNTPTRNPLPRVASNSALQGALAKSAVDTSNVQFLSLSNSDLSNTTALSNNMGMICATSNGMQVHTPATYTTTTSTTPGFLEAGETKEYAVDNATMQITQLLQELHQQHQQQQEEQQRQQQQQPQQVLQLVQHNGNAIESLKIAPKATKTRKILPKSASVPEENESSQPKPLQYITLTHAGSNLDPNESLNLHYSTSVPPQEIQWTTTTAANAELIDEGTNNTTTTTYYINAADLYQSNLITTTTTQSIATGALNASGISPQQSELIDKRSMDANENYIEGIQQQQQQNQPFMIVIPHEFIRDSNGSNATQVFTSNNELQLAATPQTVLIQQTPVQNATSNNTHFIASSSPSAESPSGHQQHRHNVSPLVLPKKEEQTINLNCRFCHKGPKFTNNLDYSNHIIAMHPAENPYNCPQCPMLFTKRVHRQHHIAEEHRTHRFRCAQCGQGFCAQRTLDLHLQRYHAPESPQQQQQPIQSQRYARVWHDAAATHTQSPLVRVEDVHLHVSEEGKGKRGELAIDLQLDNSQLSTEPSTSSQASKQQQRILCCPDCDESCEDFNNSETHLHTHAHHSQTQQQPTHVTMPSPEQTEPDSTSTTTLRYFRKRRLSGTKVALLGPTCDHQLVNERVLRSSHNCLFCEERFTNEIALRRHHQLAHSNSASMPFVCSICKRGFRMRTALQRHMETHDSEGRPYECNLCRVRFPRPSQLTLHKLTVHFLKKPHACNECGKTFGTESALKTHHKFHGAHMKVHLPLGIYLEEDAPILTAEEKEQLQQHHDVQKEVTAPETTVDTLALNSP